MLLVLRQLLCIVLWQRLAPAGIGWFVRLHPVWTWPMHAPVAGRSIFIVWVVEMSPRFEVHSIKTCLLRGDRRG